METIKSYTDLSQSKKLADILPFESADMIYPSYFDFPFVWIEKPKKDKNAIPCWSLAVLLGVLPKGTNISTPKPINALGYCCWNQYDEIYANNPVDACVAMIERLHELKML